jgi:hypothetical protein
MERRGPYQQRPRHMLHTPLTVAVDGDRVGALAAIRLEYIHGSLSDRVGPIVPEEILVS